MIPSHDGANTKYLDCMRLKYVQDDKTSFNCSEYTDKTYNRLWQYTYVMSVRW